MTTDVFNDTALPQYYIYYIYYLLGMNIFLHYYWTVLNI